MVLRQEFENPTPTLVTAVQAFQRLDPTPVVGEVSGDGSLPSLTQLRLNSSQIDEIVAAYAAGTTARDLGFQFGVNRKPICRHLRTRGVALRVRPLTEPDIAAAIQLYRQGLSLAQVGKRLDRDHTVIRRAITRAGI